MPGPAQNTKQQAYLIFLEIIIIIVGLVWGVWQPMKTLKALSSEKKQKQAELEKVKGEEDQLAILKRDFNKYQEKINSLQIAVPDQPNIADALIALEAIGNQAGATITELTPTSGGKDGKVTFDYSAQCSFEGAKQIVSLFSTNLRPIKITGINIGAVTSEAEEPINIAFKLEMPYLSGESMATTSAGSASTSETTDVVNDETSIENL